MVLESSYFSSADFPFDFLHSEIVDLFFHSPSTEDVADKSSGMECFESPVFKPSPTTKIEFMGYRVGYSLIERLTKDFPRFSTDLDCMKFLCKEFWSTVFKKQVDNLRTNHQGTYVVQDNQFRLLAPLSVGEQYATEAPRYLAFTCGLLRGALANLGITAQVTTDTLAVPAVKFNIIVQHSSS